jgi:hypothetical protein
MQHNLEGNCNLHSYENRSSFHKVSLHALLHEQHFVCVLECLYRTSASIGSIQTTSSTDNQLDKNSHCTADAVQDWGKRFHHAEAD